MTATARADAARRYVGWIERNRWPIVLASIAVAVACALLSARISIRADFSYLLPQSARSVQDLRAIEKRARVIGTAMIAVVSDHPASRERAAQLARDRALALGPGMVASITFDEREQRQYAWTNRWLFADLADLTAARDSLEREIDDAKLRANPLFVDLSDDTGSAGSDAADQLRQKLADAEAKSKDPGELISKDGRVQMMILHTGFSTGDVDKDRELVAKLDAICSDIHKALPDVEAGVAGDAPVSLAEHDAILSGMAKATLLTVALVMIALAWYFRSALAIGALSWSLTVGTLATFAFARLTLGYLNAATAFLSSIVIGNGINVGILVTARYLEELRGGATTTAALATAIEATIAGTFTAALTAAVAYASLIITVFRGFRHFGVIGGVGILLCWISGYVVLPAALAVARDWIRPAAVRPTAWIARLLPRRLEVVAAVALAITAAAGVIAVRFLAGDPFESNFRNLRSRSDDIARAQRWMTTIDQSFGQGLDAGFVIAAPKREDVAPLEARLLAVDAGKPRDKKLFDRVTSIDDVLPQAQPQKLAVLAQIRALLTGKDIDALEDNDRTAAQKLTPPADLRALTANDVPEAVAWPFVEADGSRGKLLLATSGKSYEVWDTRDTMRFASAVRGLGLADDVHTGGASFVFADVIDGVLSDGPRATVAAALGAILVVLLVIGRNRFALVTIACGLSGTLLMLGVSALAGLKVNFLDFVALPITIGIGIEYAVNIISRSRQEGDGHGREVLASTGGAVVLCSYTTAVGYGSLLLSQNLGIRSFGIAAMLGEITCLVVALYLAPALLWLARPRAA